MSGMVCRQELFDWLFSMKLVSRPDVVDSFNNMVIVNRPVSEMFCSGIPVARILDLVSRAKGGPGVDVKRLKESGAQHQRLFNWGVVQEEMFKLGVVLDPDMKNLLANGDQEVMVQTLEDIFAVSLATKNKKDNQINQDRGNLKVSDSSSRTSTSLSTNSVRKNSRGSTAVEPSMEPLIATLSELLTNAFRCDSNYARELVLSASSTSPSRQVEAQIATYKLWSNFFLFGYASPTSNIGVLSFDPMLSFLREVYASALKICRSLINTDNLLLFLRLIQPGLSSSNLDICSWVCRSYSRILPDLSDEKQQYDIYQWFIGSPINGLQSFVNCFKKHPDIRLSLFPMLDVICRPHYYQFFTQELNTILTLPSHWLAFISEILPIVKSQVATSQALIADGVIEFWVDQACRYADTGSNITDKPVSLEHSDDTISNALSLMISLWIDFPVQVESRAEVTQHMLSLLRKGVRHISRSVNIATISGLFHALENFTIERNRFAPFLFKILVFALVEHYPNEFLRHFISCNFCKSLPLMPNIPVHVILDPLLKQMAEHGFSNLDFDLLLEIAKHPRLPLKQGLLLAHQLGKLALHDLVFGRCASIPFLVLINRFVEEDDMVRYCEKYVKVDLSMFMRSVEDEKLEGGQNGSVSSVHHIRRTLALELLAKMVHLKHARIIDTCVLPSLMGVIKQHQQLYKTSHSGLQSLLAFTQQQLHLVDEEGNNAAENEKRIAALRLDANGNIAIKEIAVESVQEVEKELSKYGKDRRKSLIDKENKNLKSHQKESDASKSSKPLTNSLEDIDMKKLRSDLLPVQKRKSGNGNSPKNLAEDESTEGWPSIDVAKVFRKEFGMPLSKLFKLYVGQRPNNIKAKSFEDLERIRSLMSNPEFIKVYTDLQLSPQPLSKTDLGYIFTTANQYKKTDLDIKGQVMGLEEFLKSIWLVSQEMQKRKLAPWVELLDPSISNSQPHQARAFVLFLQQRCTDIEFAPLLEIWKKPKPKNFFSNTPNDAIATAYLESKQKTATPSNVFALQIIHQILANSKISLTLLDSKSESKQSFAASKALKNKQEAEEAKLKLIAEEKAATERKSKELHERLNLQRIEREKRETERKVNEEKRKQEIQEKAKEAAEKDAAAREKKKLELEEYRLKKEEEAKISAELARDKAEKDAAERKEKIEEWKRQRATNPDAEPLSEEALELEAKKQLNLEKTNTAPKKKEIAKEPAKLSAPAKSSRPAKSTASEELHARKDSKDSNSKIPHAPSGSSDLKARERASKPASKSEKLSESSQSTSKLLQPNAKLEKKPSAKVDTPSTKIEKQPSSTKLDKKPSAKPDKQLSGSLTKAPSKAPKSQVLQGPSGKKEHWDVVDAAQAKVNNAKDSELSDIREAALKDLESAQQEAQNIIKRVKSLHDNHNEVVATVETPAPVGDSIADASVDSNKLETTENITTEPKPEDPIPIVEETKIESEST